MAPIDTQHPVAIEPVCSSVWLSVSFLELLPFCDSRGKAVPPNFEEHSCRVRLVMNCAR